MSTAEIEAAQAAFGVAAERLACVWLQQFAEHDPAAGATVMRTLHREGGFVTIKTDLAPMTRAMKCTLTLTDMAGRESLLCFIDNDSPGVSA